MAGVAARKAEKARVRKLKDLMRQGLTILPDSELLIPIPDPEAEWKATDVTWLEEEAIRIAKKSGVGVNEEEAEEEEGEGATFITDVDGDQLLQREFILQQDFVPFGDDSDGRVEFSGDDSDSDSDIQERLGHY